MSRYWLLWGCVLTSTLILGGSIAHGGDAAQRAQRDLQGRWEFVGGEVGGEKAEWALLMPHALTFKGTTVTVEGAGGTVRTGTFKVYPGKKPAWLDLTLTIGKDRKSKGLCVYELKGNTLRLRYNRHSDGKRPTALTTLSNDDILVILKRKKP